MKMGIGDTAVLLVRLVDGEVGNHAPAHKLLRNKLPCKSDVFLQRKFVLQGNVKAICKLGFLAALGLLHGVPEGDAVLVLGGGLGRQENICADHAALVGEVVGLPVILAIQFLSGSVGRRSNGGLSRAPFNLGDVEMERANYPPFCWSAAWLTKAATSGKEKTFSIKRKKSLSLILLTSGATLSTAAPRVISLWLRFFRSPSV